MRKKKKREKPKKEERGGRGLSIDEKNSDRIRSRAAWYGKNPGQHD